MMPGGQKDKRCNISGGLPFVSGTRPPRPQLDTPGKSSDKLGPSKNAKGHSQPRHWWRWWDGCASRVVHEIGSAELLGPIIAAFLCLHCDFPVWDVDLTNIQSVSFEFDANSTGEIEIDDLEFSQ
jgi:hypothetical protein